MEIQERRRKRRRTKGRGKDKGEGRVGERIEEQKEVVMRGEMGT